MRKWLTPAALLIFALLAAAQGIALALHRSIVLDEAVTLLHSAAVSHGKWAELFDDIHMPAYNILVAGWTSVFGLEALAAKGFSVVCAVTALVITYFMSEKFLGRRVAMVATLLLSVSPMFIYYSQYARSYAMFIALSGLSSFAYLKLLAVQNRVRSKEAAFYVLATFLLLTTHMVACSLVIVQGLHSLSVALRKKKFDGFLRWFSLALLTTLLYVPVILTILHRYDLATAIPSIYSWVKMPEVYDLLLTLGYSNLDPLEIGAFFVVACGLAIMKRAEKSEVVDYLLLWLIIPSLLLFAVSHLFHPVFIRRGLAPSIVPLVILTAYGLTRFARVQWVGVVLSLVVAYWAFGENAERREMEEEPWKEVVAEISADSRPNVPMTIIVRPGIAWPSLMYYLDRECFTSEEPKSCLKKHSVALIGGSTLKDQVPPGVINWFVGYAVDDGVNRVIMDEIRKDPRYVSFKTYPEIRGIDLMRFAVTAP